MIRTCLDCGLSFDPSLGVCPHCGRPGVYTNVLAADDTAEVSELEARHVNARANAAARACETLFDELEMACAHARVAINRDWNETFRLATSDQEIYSTYYLEAAAQRRGDLSSDSAVRRAAAEATMFPGYYQSLRWGMLTLTGTGPWNWGPCSWLLKNEMIAHRTSFTEGNNVVMLSDKGLHYGDEPPKGFRASWRRRGVLAATKLSDSLDPVMTATDLPGMLFVPGKSTWDDQFVEAQVFGPLTRQTWERVSVVAPTNPTDRALLTALTEKMKGAPAPLVVL